MTAIMLNFLLSNRIKSLLLFLVASEIPVSVGLINPIEDCLAADIDLVLVPESDRLGNYLPGMLFQQPMLFLTKFINIFLKPGETDLKRLRVSVVVAGKDEPKVLVSFNDFTTVQGLKNHILNNLTHVLIVGPTSLAKSVAFARDIFDESYGARVNASHVMVLFLDFMSGEFDGLHTMKALQKEGVINSSKATVYTVAIHFPMDSNEIPELDNAVYIRSSWGDDQLQVISMAFCQSCVNGWFTFKHPHPRQGSSCYTIVDAQDQAYWYDSWALCSNKGIDVLMAVFETKEEVEFIKTTVINALLSKHFNSDILNLTSSEQGIDLYIALIRQSKTIGHRFNWIGGQPMIVTHWASGQPDGGKLQGCGAWRFIINNAGNKHTSDGQILFNTSLTSYTEGWLDIGCWDYLTRFVLCEIKIPSTSPADFPVIQPANKKSLNKAFESGDFFKRQGTLRAISAALETSKKIYDKKEKHFDCADDGFRSKKILYSSVCDHITDCLNGRDENICHYKLPLPYSCSAFSCKSSQCVPREFVCDLITDCVDGSDEEHCEAECKGYRCSDGNCLPKHRFFDGEVDCHGHTKCSEGQTHDESISNSVEEGDEHCAFICNRTQCVYPSQLNDTVIDCQGPEGPLDETIGKLEAPASCYNLLNHVIWAPRCVYIKDKYQGVLGCPDMSHLQDCEDFACVEGYIKCPFSYCIPLHFLGDGNLDCPNGEDEDFSWQPDCTGHFECFNGDKNPICLHPDLVCDGHSHCPHGDDELNCHTSCPGSLRCIGGTVMVREQKLFYNLSELDPRTKYLDLSAVDLASSLPFKEGLNSLIEVCLSQCKIISIESLGDILEDWKTVYWLDLSYNLIEKLEFSLFISMQNLHVFNLSHNYNLKSIVKGYNVNSMFLNVLDLSYTAISTLPEEFFVYFTKLQHLNLSYTEIKRLDGNAFPSDFSLYSFDLRGAPIQSFSSNPFNGLTILSDLYTDKYGLCCEQMRGSKIPGHKCHAPEDAISSCYNLMAHSVQRVLLWIIGMTSVLGNLMVIVYRCIWDRRILTKAYGLFVTSLGVADLTMGVYLLIIASADLYYRGNFIWNEDAWLHSTACQAAGFLSTFSSETSTFFIALVTLDRYLVIKYPFGDFRFSRHSMSIVTVVAWCTGFLLALIPALPRLKEWSVYNSNAMCLGLPLDKGHTDGWAYSTAIFVVLNFVLFVGIAFGQHAIYRSLWSQRANTAGNNVHVTARRAQDITVAQQLLLVAVSDFLCWFPIGVMGFMVMAGHNIGNDAYVWSAVIILPINSAVNPVLYTLPVVFQKWKRFKYGVSRSHSQETHSAHAH